jgi:hypothetical protein
VQDPPAGTVKVVVDGDAVVEVVLDDVVAEG